MQAGEVDVCRTVATDDDVIAEGRRRTAGRFRERKCGKFGLGFGDGCGKGVRPTGELFENGPLQPGSPARRAPLNEFRQSAHLARHAV